MGYITGRFRGKDMAHTNRTYPYIKEAVPHFLLIPGQMWVRRAHFEGSKSLSPESGGVAAD